MNKSSSATDHRFSDEDVAEKVKNINYSFGSVFERLLVECGVTVSDAARACGISRTAFVKKLEPGSGNKMSIGNLYMMPDVVKIAFCKHLLGDKYNVVHMPDGQVSESDHFRFISECLRQANDTFAHAIESIADGHLTRGEADTLKKMCDETITRVVRLREIAGIALKEGVISVPRGTMS